MPYIQGENREQMTLIPLCLDDYIGSDSICRVIAVYVGSLDMSALGFKYGETKDTGRPPFSPSSMLMLYLYGYLNRIRSSRRLESETKRNVEVMWLMKKLTPDDKTISNFRKDNAPSLKKVFRNFSLWCSREGLYGKELVVVDGSKIRADSSRRNIHTQKGTEKELASVEKKINEYMSELERNDTAEADETRLSPSAIREILERLNAKKDTLQDWLKKIAANEGKEISVVDPDAHMMHTNGDGRNLDACYNVQSVVDGKHKLIVDFDVSTCPDDSGALSLMTESAKTIMGVDEIAVTADKGYYDGSDIERCEQNGTACYVPKTGDYAHAPNRRYDQSHFRYDKENDCYICPEGQTLSFRQLQLSKRKGSTESIETGRVYYDNRVCRVCPNKAKCTVNKRDGRKIYRNLKQDTLDVVNARMRTAEGREILRERKKIVEHPFGTTKAVWGYRQFLCRGREKTTAEMSLTFLAYNLRRVFNIFKENDKNLTEMLV
ncbi:MAG: IS1182 family transposase [Clostridiales bacterium]|jgi:transposase|nr:IS1182 family transposase [Clostridiales bacterium]